MILYCLLCSSLFLCSLFHYSTFITLSFQLIVLLKFVGLEGGSGDRHSSEDSCNSSFSLQNIPPGKDLAEELHGSQSQVVGKNDRKVLEQEQERKQGTAVGEAVQEGVSGKSTSSSLIPKYRHPQEAKEEVEEECLEVDGKEGSEGDEGIVGEEDEEEEEVVAVEKKVDYRNDTQISTKEKKEKKSAVESSMKGSFGVLPPNPPSNVEVHKCLTTLHRIALPCVLDFIKQNISSFLICNADLPTYFLLSSTITPSFSSLLSYSLHIFIFVYISLFTTLFCTRPGS